MARAGLQRQRTSLNENINSFYWKGGKEAGGFGERGNFLRECAVLTMGVKFCVAVFHGEARFMGHCTATSIICAPTGREK